MEEIVIRVWKSEEGLMYAAYVDPEHELPEDSDFGGVCTSGMDAPEEGWSPEDWRNAIGMAEDAAIEAIPESEFTNV